MKIMTGDHGNELAMFPSLQQRNSRHRDPSLEEKIAHKPHPIREDPTSKKNYLQVIA